MLHGSAGKRISKEEGDKPLYLLLPLRLTLRGCRRHAIPVTSSSIMAVLVLGWAWTVVVEHGSADCLWWSEFSLVVSFRLESVIIPRLRCLEAGGLHCVFVGFYFVRMHVKGFMFVFCIFAHGAGRCLG